MDDFYLCPIDDIDNPKYDFYLLYKDGRNFYEEFAQSLRQQSELDELDSIMALMDKVDNNNLSTSKYRHISGGKYDRKDVWEFKSKHLRIYTLKVTPNYYIVLGGYKKGQEKDIAKIFKHFNNIPDEIPVRDNDEDDNEAQQE